MGSIDSCHVNKMCAYCRVEQGFTRDHVFPRGWYPTTTPANQTKWTVPACDSCNNVKASLEGVVRTWLSASVDPNHDAARGVWEQSVRAIDPTTEKSDRDAGAKRKAQEALISSIIRPSQLAPEKSNRLLNVSGSAAADAALQVDNRKVTQLFELFALGCFRYLNKRPLNLGSKIEKYFAHTPDQVDLFEQNVR